MIKATTKVFFLLCILLGGYSSMYANSYQDCTRCTSVNASKSISLHKPGIVLNLHAALTSYTSKSPKQENSRIYAEEKEEGGSEFSFVKKLTDTGYFLSLFQKHATRYTCFNFKIYSRFSEYRSHYSSIRYLILRMIRV